MRKRVSDAPGNVGKNYPPPTAATHYPRHPFGDRNNFPGVDNAFDSKELSSSSHRPSPSNNTSVCSTSHSLDMSIGARAALTDHWRHVAKYGVDGDVQLDEEATSPESSQERLWNQLLDTTSPSLNTSSSSGTMPYPYVVTADGAIEVSMSEASYSDYFNSSKVMLLSTPEKNKNNTPRVLSRGEEMLEIQRELESSLFDNDDEGDIDTSADSANLSHLFQAALHLDADSSFAGGVDVSRISEKNLDDIDESFAVGGVDPWGGVDVSRISAADSDHNSNVATPLRGSPSRSFVAFMADSPATQPSNVFDITPTKVSRPWRRSQPQHQHRHHFQQQQQQKQQRLLSPPSRHDQTSFSSCLLSPVEAQAASMAVRLGPVMSKAAPFPLESNASDDGFINLQPRQSSALFDDRPLSPITQVNLSAIEFASIDGGSSFVRSSSSDKQSCYSERKKVPRSNSSNRSMHSCTPSPTDDRKEQRNNYEDRRRYRTVVPSRVFFKDVDDDADDDDDRPQDDSFAPLPLSSGGGTADVRRRSGTFKDRTSPHF